MMAWIFSCTRLGMDPKTQSQAVAGSKSEFHE